MALKATMLELSAMDSVRQPQFNEEESHQKLYTEGRMLGRNITDPKLDAPPYGSLDALKGSKRTTPKNRKPWPDILWAMLSVIAPMSLLTAVILGLVFAYQISPPNTNALDFEDSLQSPFDGDYIHVDFSATRLIFVASWSSSLAPLLAGFCMSLWLPWAAQQIAKSTQQKVDSDLCTPFQIGLIINLMTGSFSQLLSFVKYSMWKPKAPNPPILNRTVFVMSTIGLISVAIFAADTALHYTTNSVPYRFQTQLPGDFHKLGRSLSSDCLHFDRSENFAYPCSYIFDNDLLQDGDPSAVDFPDQFALTSLLHNTSRLSQIQAVTTPDLPHGDLLILLPSMAEIPKDLNFRAPTIGVSTQCQPMTRACRFRNMTRPKDDGSTLQMASFNCTKNFWGVLLDIDNSDVAPLSVQGSGMTYGYFSGNLINPYNSLGIDVESGPQTSSEMMVADSDLLNPIGLAVATVIDIVLGPKGDALRQDPDMVPYARRTLLTALNCSFTTYDVEYGFFNGTVKDVRYQQTKNGTVAEVFHATADQFSMDYASAFKLASLQKSATGIGHVFANQHSQVALSVIGSVTTPTRNLREFRVEEKIVTRISRAALWSLVIANILFVLLGLFLGFSSFWVWSRSLQDLTSKLSVEGITALALEESTPQHGAVASAGELFAEKFEWNRCRRVGARPNANGGYDIEFL